MKCPNCGNVVENGLKYCTYCGEPIKVQVQQPCPPVAPPPPQSQNPGGYPPVSSGQNKVEELLKWCIASLFICWPLAVYGFSKRSEAMKAVYGNAIAEHAITVIKKWLKGIAIFFGIVILLALITSA